MDIRFDFLLYPFCNVCLDRLWWGQREKIDKIETESGIVAIGEFNKGDTLICNPINSQSDEGKAVIEKIKYEDYDKKSDVYIYDIHIKNGDVKVKPNGKVKITMPAPTISAYGFTTFHIMPNDMVEMMSTTYNDGKITFETIDFSYFIVAKMHRDMILQQKFKAKVAIFGGETTTKANFLNTDLEKTMIF